ncbi:hypothetical protein [Actinomadura fulvescens]
MASATDVTYRGWPTWKLPSEGRNYFGEPGDWYQVPDLRMHFGLLAGERYRVEFWFQEGDSSLGPVAKLWHREDQEEGPGRLVFERDYRDRDYPYGALAFEELGQAYQAAAAEVKVINLHKHRCHSLECAHTANVLTGDGFCSYYLCAVHARRNPIRWRGSLEGFTFIPIAFTTGNRADAERSS